MVLPSCKYPCFVSKHESVRWEHAESDLFNDSHMIAMPPSDWLIARLLCIDILWHFHVRLVSFLSRSFVDSINFFKVWWTKPVELVWTIIVLGARNQLIGSIVNGWDPISMSGFCQFSRKCFQAYKWWDLVYTEREDRDTTRRAWLLSAL